LQALLLGGPWRGDLGLGFLFGLGLFKILDGELKLFDRKRRSQATALRA
jgi:hypothetical protein